MWEVRCAGKDLQPHHLEKCIDWTGTPLSLILYNLPFIITPIKFIVFTMWSFPFLSLPDKAIWDWNWWRRWLPWSTSTYSVMQPVFWFRTSFKQRHRWCTHWEVGEGVGRGRVKETEFYHWIIYFVRNLIGKQMEQDSTTTNRNIIPTRFQVKEAIFCVVQKKATVLA